MKKKREPIKHLDDATLNEYNVKIRPPQQQQQQK